MSIIKAGDLAARVIEGQAFIINTKTSVLHELDETGTFIWKLIERKKSRQDIVSALVSEFEVSEQQAGLDLDEFLNELEQKGLISA